jgi:hypothetical protein
VAQSHADDVCVLMPCLNSGTCISQGSNYECKCPTGYTGRNCEMIMKCNADPCQHFVSCHDHVSLFMLTVHFYNEKLILFYA